MAPPFSDIVAGPRFGFGAIVVAIHASSGAKHEANNLHPTGGAAVTPRRAGSRRRGRRGWGSSSSSIIPGRPR
jgi:hypothetical protein